jgi:hypothetical protein
MTPQKHPIPAESAGNPVHGKMMPSAWRRLYPRERRSRLRSTKVNPSATTRANAWRAKARIAIGTTCMQRNGHIGRRIQRLM